MKGDRQKEVEKVLAKWEMTDRRSDATIERLISNIPAACKALEEAGHTSLAGQLRRDCDNLVYWQEHGLVPRRANNGYNARLTETPE